MKVRFTPSLVFVCLILCAFCFSCALQTPISGGKKDQDGPIIEASSPLNYSTNFNSSKIAFQFNEYVVVKNLQKELIVSPPLKYPLEYKIKGKSIIFSVKDTLQKNTTYNFNFGKSIVDFTEGNPLDSNLYVFSTGNELDSGYISGVLKNAFDLKPIKEAYVYAYLNKSDTAFVGGEPDYVARTNDKGAYSLPFISDGKYSVYGILDKNSSYSYDLPGEEIAFSSLKVDAQSGEPVDMYMFKEDNRKQYVRGGKQKDYRSLNIKFNDRVKSATTIKALNVDLGATYKEWNEGRDSLMLWMKNLPSVDTIVLEVTNKTALNDTLKIAWESKEKYLGKKRMKLLKEEGEYIKVEPILKSGSIDYFDQFYLKFPYPIINIDFSKVMLVEDNDTLGFNLLKSKLKTSMQNKDNVKQLPVDYDWKKGTSYKMVVYPGAFKDVNEITTDTTNILFRTLKFEDYGNLEFTVNAPNAKHKYLLQLLNGDNKVIEEYSINSTDKISIPLIRPGDYGFKLIYDKNSNKKWDTGDLKSKRQPEKVVFYSKPISIRANWDVVLEWNIKE